MTLSDLLEDDLDLFFDTDEFAEEVNYTPDGGDPATITAQVFIERELGDEVRGKHADIRAEGYIVIKASDVERPQRGDRVTITHPDGSDELWDVNDGWTTHKGMHRVPIFRDLRTQ